MNVNIAMNRAAQISDLLATLTALIAEPVAVREEPRPTPTRLLLTVDEAAERLGIGRTTAWSLVRSGDLESVQIGRLRRVHVDTVAAYAADLVAKRPAA